MTETNGATKLPYSAIFWATDKKLRAVLGNEDPAPWLDVDPSALSFPGEDPAAYCSACKFQERAKLVLLRALLTGSLTATFVDGEEKQAIPGWAWDCPSRNAHILFDGRLPLDPLLPDEWLRWSRVPFEFDQTEIDTLLDSAAALQIEGLPAMPPAFDCAERPKKVPQRLPPKQPWITLSQAISWAAFRVSLDRNDLFDVMEDGSVCGTKIRTRRAVADATAALLLQASGGDIKMMGKLTPFGMVPLRMTGGGSVQTEEIPAYRLIDFGLFDYLSDGLSFGQGVRWHSDEGPYFRVIDPNPPDSYEEVKVKRDALLATLPAPHSDVVALMLAMLPASLPEIGLVMGLDEAICLTAYGKPSNDLHVWTNAAGDLDITNSDGESLISDNMDSKTSEPIERYVAANRALCKALRDGSLTGYVAPSDRVALVVPRLYWNSVAPDNLEVIFRGSNVGENGGGSRVLLSRTMFDEWRKSNAGHDIKGTSSTRAPGINGRGHQPVVLAPSDSDAEQFNQTAKVKRGPVPNAKWPEAIREVAAQVKAANYTVPLRRDQKTKIANKLIKWFNDPEGGPSLASAMNYAKNVIALLPRREL